MKLTLTFTAALLLFVAACGGDDGGGEGRTILSDADGIISDDDLGLDDLDDFDLDDFDDFDLDDFDAGDDLGFDGPVHLEVDVDEQREVVGDLFDGKDRGRGTGTMMGRSYFLVEVDGDDFTDAQLVAGCESISDFVFDLPEERASGPVDIFVSESFQVGGDDEEHLVANEGLIPRQERGSCEVQ
jgi:hypothetical protein